MPKGVNSFAGAESAFSHDGKKLLYYHNGANSPGDTWTYDLTTGKSAQVTHSLMAGVPADHMVEPFLVHYPSRDGKWTISAWVYVTRNMQRNGQNAAIVYIHGGPKSQSVDSFNRFIQHIVNQGYMVIAPNYRGSTGYGKAFEDANLFDMGGGDLQDVLAAADFLKQTGYLDPKKVVAMGGSYGGYMTMMAVTKAPDVWAAGVPIVPFVNWFTETVGPCNHGRSQKESRLLPRTLAILLCRSDQGAASIARGRARSALPERRDRSSCRCH